MVSSRVRFLALVVYVKSMGIIATRRNKPNQQHSPPTSQFMRRQRSDPNLRMRDPILLDDCNAGHDDADMNGQSITCDKTLCATKFRDPDRSKSNGSK